MKHLYLWGMRALALFLFIIIASNALIYVASRPYIYDDAQAMLQAEVAIVPGAAVLGNAVPAPIFADRADAAIALYKAGKVSKILVSGDNSAVSHNEVNPARRYLLERGIPDQDIFLDHAGFDTYSSMYRARAIFGVSSAVITTQSFHLPRAVFIARRMGIDAYGMNADLGHILLRNYLREVLANEKALLDLALRRTPKYLGDPIPITGDGRNYP